MARWMSLLMLALGGSVYAADSPDLQKLNLLLNVINQEQQSLVQQIQVTQETRRNNYPCGGQLVPPGMIDYAEWVDAQRSAMRRENELRERLERLHSRWDELETRKQPLLQRIYELAAPKQE